MALLRLSIYLALVVAGAVWLPLGLALVVAVVFAVIATAELHRATVKGRALLARRRAEASAQEALVAPNYREVATYALWIGLVTQAAAPPQAPGPEQGLSGGLAADSLDGGGDLGGADFGGV